jgi:hypothetical protein
LTTTGDLSPCKSKRTLIQLLNVNSLPPRRPRPTRAFPRPPRVFPTSRALRRIEVSPSRTAPEDDARHAGPTGPSAASPLVRAYQGGHHATACLDDALALKHEVAPLLNAVTLLLSRARRTPAPGSAAGSPLPPPLDIFRRPPPKPPSHSGTLPSIHSTPPAHVASSSCGHRYWASPSPLAGTLHPQPSTQTGR